VIFLGRTSTLCILCKWCWNFQHTWRISQGGKCFYWRNYQNYLSTSSSI